MLIHYCTDHLGGKLLLEPVIILSKKKYSITEKLGPTQ